MSEVIDLTGQRFNRLIVIEPSRTKNGKYAWKCLCDCGNYTIAVGAQLKNGNTKSCGCYKNDIARKRFMKHGLSRTKLFHVYQGMHSRCENKKSRMYKHYGGRGVSVCEEWSGEAGVVNFCEWSMDNGYEEGLQIDRIDNDGNYEPSNCRWVTCQENLMNKSNTLFYEYNGNKKTLQDWAIVSNIPYKRLRARIKECGWSFEKAITTPYKMNKNNKNRKEVI